MTLKPKAKPVEGEIRQIIDRLTELESGELDPRVCGSYRGAIQRLVALEHRLAQPRPKNVIIGLKPKASAPAASMGKPTKPPSARRIAPEPKPIQPALALGPVAVRKKPESEKA